MAIGYIPKTWITEANSGGPPAVPPGTPLTGEAITAEFTALRDYVRSLTSAGALTPTLGRQSGLNNSPVLRSFVDYADFPGADLTGATDGAPTLRTAVATLAAVGGTLWVGAGVCSMGSVDRDGDCVPIPPDCKGVRVQGSGWDSTFFRGSSACKRFIDPAAGYADGDRFCNVWLLDLTWDDAGVGGSEHKLAGAWKNGWWVARINIDHIGGFRVRTINIPSGAQSGSWRFGITDLVDQPTQYSLTDIWLAEFEFNGGTFGATAVGAVSSPGNSVNVYVDHIHYWDGWHSPGVKPTGFAFGAHVHLVSQGWGGEECDVVNVRGEFSPDVSFEGDGVGYGMFRRCIAKDPHTHHFLHRVFNSTNLGPYPNARKCVFEHCIAIADQLLNGVGAFTASSSVGVAIGEMAVLHCQYIKIVDQVFNCGVGEGCAIEAGQIGPFAGIPLCDMAFLNVVDFTIIDTGTTWPAGTGSMWSAYVNLNLETSPTVTPLIRLQILFDIEFTNLGTGTDGVVDWGFIINGNGVLDCDLTFTHLVSGNARNGNFHLGYLGGNTGATGPPVASTSTLSGKVNVTVRQISGDATPKGFTVAGTGTLTIPAGQAIEFNSNWGNWTGPNINRVTLAATAQTQVTAQLRQSGLRRVTGNATISPDELGVIALTPGAAITLPSGMWLAHASASFVVVNGAGATAGISINTAGAARIGNNLTGVTPLATDAALNNAGEVRVYTPDTNLTDLIRVG